MSRTLGMTRGVTWPLAKPHSPEHDCFACAEVREKRGRPALAPLLSRRPNLTGLDIARLWHRANRRRGV